MSNEGKTFKIISMGCKVNYYEKQSLASFLLSKGLIEVKNDDPSDISIINTCAVTEEAARKSRQMLRRTINENPSEICVVMGCLSQIDQSVANIKGVSVVLGSSNKGMVLEAIKEYQTTGKPVLWVDKNIFKSEYDNFTVSHFEAHTRAFLKVEDGCENFCTYCVIPFARGNVRSKPLDLAVSEAKELVNNGHKEIIISGIHTGAYGKDLGITLYDLLKALDEIDGLERIRISSIEINQITDQILDLVKASHKIVHHFHIPLQAGSERVLKLMNRHYSKEEYLKRVKEIREAIPDISLTTDYIVGFPTETDDDFKESLATLEEIGFDTIHTFPFSKRKGTKAYLMKDVDPEIKKARSKAVLKLSKEGYSNLVNRNIGKNLDVIFEVYEDSYVYGHTGNYLYLKAKGTPSDLNKLLYAKVIGGDEKAVLAEIVR